MTYSIIFIVMKDVESAALAAAPLPLELEKLGRVIACYRTLSRVIAVIASYRGDNSVIAGPRTLRNRGARSHNLKKSRKVEISKLEKMSHRFRKVCQSPLRIRSHIFDP